MRIPYASIRAGLVLAVVQGLQPNAAYKSHCLFAVSTGRVTSVSRGDQQVAPATQRSNLFPHVALKASTTSNGDDEVVEWTKPRLHNNPMIRSGVILAALAATGLSAPFGKLPSVALASIHLLSFGVWSGTVFYTTFIAGLTMFKNLPRQTFGKLQSKLFPKYFALCSLTIVLQVKSN